MDDLEKLETKPYKLKRAFFKTLRKMSDIPYLARYTHSYICAWYSAILWQSGLYSFPGFLFMFWHRYYRTMDWHGMGKKNQRSRPFGSIPLIIRYYGYGPAIAEFYRRTEK